MKTRLVTGTIAVLLLASMLSMAFVSTVEAHTESVPFETDLIAGQNTNVGEVEVWNDGDYLYVKYVTDGWYITEVHLHVAISKDGIPQKNGNPIPGKFTYSEEGLWTTEYDFDPIPLNSWSPDTALYIAAHTKVREAITTSVVSQAGVMAYGPSPTYLAVGDSGWGSPKSAVATWEHPSWPLIPGATWISTEYEIPDARLDSWRWFSDSFDVPRCPASGTVLLATSDNAEEVYLNGALIGSDGEVQGTFIDNWEWGTVVSYPFTPQEGSNTLDFIVRNYAYDTDDPHLNPTGLIYKAEVECYGREETAWGAGSPFPGKNWATYFTYTVQWKLLETIYVPADGWPNPIFSNSILEEGKLYKIVARGTAYAGGNALQTSNLTRNTPTLGVMIQPFGWMA